MRKLIARGVKAIVFILAGVARIEVHGARIAPLGGGVNPLGVAADGAAADASTGPILRTSCQSVNGDNMNCRPVAKHRMRQVRHGRELCAQCGVQ